MNGSIRFTAIVVVSVLLTGFAAPIAALPNEPVATDIAPAHHDGRVLVRVVSGTPAATLGPGSVHIFGRWYEVPTLQGEMPAHAVQRLEPESYIEVVELDRRIRLDPTTSDAISAVGIEAVTPNDPFYDLQWHLPAIEAPEAWETSSGSGVVVAVVDTGISLAGEDLDCRPLAGEFNAITNLSGPGTAVDDNRHGTHVAGSIGQCTNNSTGVAGVAGSTSLLAIKSLDSSGSGWSSDTAQGIDWARTHGADVINLSLGSSCSPPPAIKHDAIDAAIAAGIVVVAATGNDADEPGYSGQIGSPACHPDVIAVGATDLYDDLSYYSNWGTGIDVVAPGGDTRYDQDGDGYSDGVLQETFATGDPTDWGYWFFQGTSMATPHVSGAAALLISANPSASAYQVKKALELTAVDLGSAGWDIYYGYGLIDADRALDAILDSEAPSWLAGSTVDVVPGETSADLSWDAATDNIAVTGYVIWLDGSPVADSSTTAYSLTGLTPGTNYSVAVQAGDLMENMSAVGSATSFDTTGTVDIVAPTWPSGSSLDADIVDDDWIWFEWPAADDNVAVTIYRVLQDGVAVLTTSNTYATVEHLAEGTAYVFRVEAGDAAGNWSTSGPAVTVTTEDWSFPQWVSGASLEATDVLEDSATFSWAPATDPSGIAEYRVWVDFEYHSTTGATSLTVTGLDPDTRYMAWVEAEDPAGNWSIGPELWFTTALDFSDTNGSTFEVDIAWLAGAGITKGCNPPLNTEYCPDSFVTRGQMAAFMVRALGYTDSGGGNLFTDDDGSVFEADIDRLAAAGVTRGCNPPSNTMYCPNDGVTRGQMAAFLHRALGGA